MYETPQLAGRDAAAAIDGVAGAGSCESAISNAHTLTRPSQSLRQRGAPSGHHSNGLRQHACATVSDMKRPATPVLKAARRPAGGGE